MKTVSIGYLYLFLTIFTTVCSQIIIKWRVSTTISHWVMPLEILGKLGFLFKVIFDPFVFCALFLTFTSGLCWMATMTKFDISYAYPFTMLGFVAVLVLSAILLGENFNLYKLYGCIFIVIGVLIASRGL